MNWTDTMKENANRVSREPFAIQDDIHAATSMVWDPHDVWLTRVKQPRDRAAIRAMAATLQQAGKPQR